MNVVDAWELTCWRLGRGARAWARQVPVRGHKQERAFGPQRDCGPDARSLDRQGGVSEGDWASPTPGRHMETRTENLHQVALTARASCPPPLNLPWEEESRGFNQRLRSRLRPATQPPSGLRSHPSSYLPSSLPLKHHRGTERNNHAIRFKTIIHKAYCCWWSLWCRICLSFASLRFK